MKQIEVGYGDAETWGGRHPDDFFNDTSDFKERCLKSALNDFNCSLFWDELLSGKFVFDHNVDALINRYLDNGSLEQGELITLGKSFTDMIDKMITARAIKFENESYFLQTRINSRSKRRT
jgi:hypothetical protein